MILLLLLVCWGCGSGDLQASVSIHVFVDRNGNGLWDEGDVGLPGVAMTMDGSYAASSDELGMILLSEVSQAVHVFAISDDEACRLQECGFAVVESKKTIDVAREDVVQFELVAVGFLQANLKRNTDAEADSVSNSTPQPEEDCGCPEEG